MSYMEQQALKKFPAGSVIFKEKDPGGSMFVIQSGTIEVSTVINKQKKVLATIGKGSILGEMSLLDAKPRSAMARAVTDVTCLEVSKMLFNNRLKQMPPWMRTFFGVLSERLREANKKQITLQPVDISRQIVFLLSNFLSQNVVDSEIELGSKSFIPMQESAENIAFLINQPVALVLKVMNKLTLSKLAHSSMNYEVGRVFASDDVGTFNSFAEFCKERYFAKQGGDVSPEYEERSPEELQILNLISKLMTEQATASDLNVNYLNDRCNADLGKPLDSYSFELKQLQKRGILKTKLDINEEKTYIVNRDLLGMKMGSVQTLAMFEELEKKLS